MIENEKKEYAANVPLPLDRAGRGAAEGMTAAAEEISFRGEPIAWLTVPTTKTVVTENAIGDSEASEMPSRKEQWILFRSNRYKKEDFYKMAFP